MKTLGRRRFWSDGSERQQYNDVCFFTLEFKSLKQNESWNWGDYGDYDAKRNENRTRE